MADLIDYHDSRDAKDIVGRHSAATYGTDGYVRWQIPAVGSARLSPEDAKGLAQWLRENDCQEIRFLLVGALPEDVAEKLEYEAGEIE